MQVVVATHPASLEHDPGEWHPERAARVEAVLRGIRGSGLEVVEFEAPGMEIDELALVHDRSYVEDIEAICRLGGGMLDADTIVSPQSWEAAIRSAGAVRAVVEELEVRSGATGFAVTRPPGHHATRDRAMGFCLFNNVALTARWLRQRHQRVVILDWDVHHGNGTQALLGDDPGVLFVSVHQSNFYPFEGHLADIEMEAPGTNINVPIPAGTGGDVVREVWGELLLPVVERFEPDWVLISCGFDAHVFDPIGELRLVDSDYQWISSRIADIVPAERTVLALEGGYDLEAIEDSTAAALRGLAGQDPEGPSLASREGSDRVLGPAKTAIDRFWS